MMSVINIRRVKAGDANTLAYIQTESWKNAFNKILSKENLDKYTNINEAIELYNMLLSKNIGNGFILSINENPHCIAYWDKARDEEMKGYSEIICIHSLCDNWGKGYGTVMMDYILRDIKNAGFSKVMLWVFKENIRARKFYENHGFVLTDKSQKFCDAVEVMYCKDL
ncbi:MULTISPECIES: GNAT family N-acetyltransferase [Clostridium]|uniref:GNAT family N-acetyltransferase n=1 Tax=Clostridium TaxID=1485 RepID=UPI001FAD445D|nr:MULTISPECIES: GNAT family N-acetyltransferase [Clostridium]MDI9216892.1 GNAT family N-acetyltransferase [Clostridium tertium]